MAEPCFACDYTTLNASTSTAYQREMYLSISRLYTADAARAQALNAYTSAVYQREMDLCISRSYTMDAARTQVPNILRPLRTSVKWICPPPICTR